MKQTKLEIDIHDHVGVPDQFLDQLRKGVLEISMFYAPKFLPGFMVEIRQKK